jgi:tRNA (mo5U34)-methyltransferase
MPKPIQQEAGADIHALMAQKPWYHSFEVAPGVWTPGQARFYPDGYCAQLGIAEDLSGLTALDIGTYDGPLAFELERRGAKVVASDIQDPDRTGFNTAKTILNSRVEYVRTSVYELSRHFEAFDLIFFCGVYYHLKHPILGFEEIGKVSKANTKLYIEGEILRTYVETLDGRRRLPLLARTSEVPYCASYPGRYRGAPNWFVPNLTCLKGWLACGGYQLERYVFVEGFRSTAQRIFGSAVRTGGGEIVEHGLR